MTNSLVCYFYKKTKPVVLRSDRTNQGQACFGEI